MTGYVAGVSVVEVVQLVAGERCDAERDVPPEVNVSVPVAPAGSPAAVSVSVEPYTMVSGDAVSSSVTIGLGHREARAGRGGALVVTVAGVRRCHRVHTRGERHRRLAAGGRQGGVHKADPCDVKVTVPVASPGSPVTASVSCMP